MSAYDVIRAKRAIRQFTDQPITDEIAETILNAGRLAQSSKNLQERLFVAIRDRETLKALSTCGDWAGAAMGIAILTPDPSIKFQLMFDAGQSAAYMQLAAWELVLARAWPLFMTAKKHVASSTFRWSGICVSPFHSAILRRKP